MNPELPNESREALETNLTALILGELPEAEAQTLRQRIASDPELQMLHRKLQFAAELVKEVSASGPGQASQTSAPELRLDPARREKLLSQFRTVPLPAIARGGRRSTAWLLPVAMAALIFLFAAALFLPALSKAKSRSMKYSLLSTAGTDSTAGSEVGRVQELRRRSAVATATTVNEPTVSFANSGTTVPATPASQPANAPEGAVRDYYSKNAGAPPPVAAAGLADVSQQASSFGVGGDGVVAGKPVAQQKVEIVLPSAGDSFQSLAVDSAAAARVQAQIEPGPGVALNETVLAQSKTVPAAGSEQQVPLEIKLPTPAFRGTPIDLNAAPDPGAYVPQAESASTLPLAAAQAPALRSGGNAGIANFGGIGGGGAGGMSGGAAPTERITERYEQLGATSESLSKAKQTVNGTVAAGNYFWSEQGVAKGQKQIAEAESLGRPTLGFAPPAAVPPTLGDTPTLGVNFAGRANQDTEAKDKNALVEGRLSQDVDTLAVTPSDELARARGDRNPAPVAGISPERTTRLLSEVRSKASANRQDNALLARGYTNAAQSAAAEPEARLRFMRRYGLAGGPAPTLSAPASAAAKAAGEQPQEKPKLEKEVLREQLADNLSNVAAPAPARPAPAPSPEVQTAENPFSTFSLNVSDVSYRLAAASLEKGTLPDPAGIRSEEFINAFDYRDPEPGPGAPVALAWERARYPFAHNRDALRFSLETAAAGRQAGKAMNLVLLLDNSGSMERADRVQIIREALRVLAAQLQPQDRLSVVTFARTATLRLDGLEGDKAAAALEEIGQLTPEGGTNLEEAMNVAYATARKHYVQSGINRVVLLTDGAANLGNVNPENLRQRVEAQRKQGIALDCFGIGWEGYNDDMLEVLSRNGDGRYAFVNTPEAAATDFAQKLAGALQIAASDVKLQVEFNPQRVSVYRQVGYAKHQLTKEQFRDNTVDAAEIASKEAGNAVYIIQTNPEGNGPIGYVRVRYKVPGTEFVHEHEWAIPYEGASVNLQDAPPAMRLAASAAAFSEWLAGSPWAAEATPDRILPLLQGVPETYGSDKRPAQFVSMVQQAQRLAGK